MKLLCLDVQGLLGDDLLQLIFEFYGGQTYLFLAPVCQQWRDVYLQTFHQPNTFCLNESLRFSMIDEQNDMIGLGILCATAMVGGDLRTVLWMRARTSVLKFFRFVPKGGDAKSAASLEQLVCVFAARRRDLRLLKWARANGYVWGEHVCACAAQNGDWDLLQWAHNNGCLWDAETCENAAGNNDMAMVQWVRANGCPWDELTCRAAVRNNNMEMLQWVRANGCPWDDNTCDIATRNNNVDMLQWALANGCPWDDDSVGVATELGRG